MQDAPRAIPLEMGGASRGKAGEQSGANDEIDRELSLLWLGTPMRNAHNSAQKERPARVSDSPAGPQKGPVSQIWLLTCLGPLTERAKASSPSAARQTSHLWLPLH